MKCEIIKDLLPLYIEKLCSAESCEEIELHLSDCPACQKDYLQLKQEYPVAKKSELITEEFLKEKDLLEKSKESIRNSYADNMIKRIFTILLTVSLILNMLMLVITFLAYRYRYPGFYFKELGTAQVCILLFPFLPALLAYLGQKAVRKLPKQKLLSRILLVSMIPAILSGSICTVLFIAIPPLGSVTDNSSHYLDLDGDFKPFERVVQSFYPAQIPDNATQISYHYERYSSLFSDKAGVEASWSLPSEEYETEKKKILESNLFKDSNVSEDGKTGIILSTIFPEKVTITFSYDDLNCRLTYCAYMRENQ